MKILFVDDEPIRAKNYTTFWDVYYAHGADMIGAYLSTHRFDLIMLDHDMPRINGQGVIHMFQEAFHIQNCPIVIHSANSIGAQEMFKLLDDYGFQDVRIKPVPSLMEMSYIMDNLK